MRRRNLPLAAVLLLGAAVAACSPAPSSPAPRFTPPAAPAWSSTSPSGSWENGGFIVNNNEWNRTEAGPQRIWADSYQDWGVTSNQSDTTSVKTYPDVQKLFSNVPISSFSKITSTYSTTTPSSGMSDTSYDIWLNNWSIEVMIWVDAHNYDVSYTPVVGSASFGGQDYTLRLFGSGYNAFVPKTYSASGSVDILGALKWLIANGKIPADATLTSIDFGWEINSTNGVPLKFQMSNYSLNTANG